MCRFSIIMPTMANRPEFIGKAVESILTQDFTDLELIIKSNAPLNNIWLDHRVKVITEEDHNLAEALNQGFRRAKGEIMNESNDDDYMIPGTLTYVNENIGDAKWCYGKIYMSNNQIMGMDYDYQRLKEVDFIPQPSVFWTREAYLELGGFDELHPLAADYEYWLRLGSKYQPKFFDRVMADYTIHPGQLTQTNLQDQCRDAQAVKEMYQ